MSISEQGFSVTANADDATIELPASMEEAPTTVIESDTNATSTISVVTTPVEAVPETELTMPAKFANADNPQDALLKAYKDLESKQSQPVEPEAPNAPEKALEALTADRKKAETVDTVSKLWADQGGSLTDDQWGKASADLGIDVADLKAYESYRKDSVANTLNDNDKVIFESAGGEDKYNQMIDWASANMDQGQLDALNTQLDNPAFSAGGMNMLKQMYTQSVGQEPEIQGGNRANTSNSLGDMFHSEGEVQAAMNHKEYGLNGAYDKSFDRKLLSFMKTSGQM